MKLNKTMLVALLAGMALCGCQKDDNGSSEEDGGTGIKSDVPLIATRTSNDNGCFYVFTYNYDSKRRLISGTGKEGANENYETNKLTYDGSQVIYSQVHKNENGEVREDHSRIIEGTLNSKGLFTTGVFKSLKGEEYGTITRRYDSEGFLVYKKETTNRGDCWEEHIYTIHDGNIVEENISDSRGNSSQRTYTYYTDKVNTVGYENMGFAFYGKQNKNLVKTETWYGKTNSYTYEFDSKNRVTKQQYSGGWCDSFTYVK